jgi:hypothetical protein
MFKCGSVDGMAYAEHILDGCIFARVYRRTY